MHRGVRRKRHWALLAAAAVFALFLLAPLVSEPIVYSPYRRRWRRYLSAAAMRAREADKAAQVRYTPPAAGPLPVWVLSLPSATARRAAVNTTLKGVAFEFVDAVDGGEELPPGELRLLMGGPRLHYARRGDAFANKKLAIDLSHFRLLFRLLASGHDAAVVLEDDAEPVPAPGATAAANPNLIRRVTDALTHTPADWDILYLSDQGVRQASSEHVGAGVAAFWDGSGTMAYVARRSLAVKVLGEAIGAKAWLNIDLLYTALIQAGEVAAYVADPPLAARSAAAGGSSLATGYAEQKGRGIIAEKLLDG